LYKNTVPAVFKANLSVLNKRIDIILAVNQLKGLAKRYYKEKDPSHSKQPLFVRMLIWKTDLEKENKNTHFWKQF
jgi:hypothetical protein